MTRLTRLLPAALAVAALALVGFFLLRNDSQRSYPHDPHALVGKVPRAKLNRILNAVSAVTASTPNAELVAAGQKLFRSNDLAKLGESCQGCHPSAGANPSLGTTPHPVSAGDFTGPRDPPVLWGVGRTAPYFWTGGAATVEAAVTGTILNHFKDGNPTPERVAAISAYLRSLDPPISSFDQGTMSPAALRGEDLFQGKGGCIGCHFGPFFTDGKLHKILVPQAPGNNDPGSPTPVPGSINTPTLRDLSNSAPYMHNGIFQTLLAVVNFYDENSIIAPLNLTPAEINDLVAYLRAL